MSNEPSHAASDSKDSPVSLGQILLGTTSSIFFAIPLAGFTAIVYRFPVPFAGYLSGPDAFLPAVMAAVFYICLGGFIVLGAAGVVMSLLVGACAPQLDDGPRLGLVLLGAAAIAELGVLVMAVLDKIIGNW